MGYTQVKMGGGMLLGTLRKELLKDERALGILLKACMGLSREKHPYL